MPLDFKDWTVDDLDKLPDDGLQYELLNGTLHVSPLPTIKHQAVRAKLGRLLNRGCPPDLVVVSTPAHWQPDLRTSLQPDVMVFPREYLDAERLCDPLTLVVEVLSPYTRRRDLMLKHVKYANAGVASYWVVDPHVPSMLAGNLIGGRYDVVGEAANDQELALKVPFPTTVTPASLVRNWRRFSTD